MKTIWKLWLIWWFRSLGGEVSRNDPLHGATGATLYTARADR
jgi:hypothetical protein